MTVKEDINEKKLESVNSQQVQKKNGPLLFIIIFILIVVFISAIILTNSNKKDVKEPVIYESLNECIKNANVGDYVKIGSYPQTANGEVQPIEWQILAIEENKMLVISRYGLEVRRFDSNSNDWKNSEINQWLNKDFFHKAFNEKDKKYIKPFDGDNVFVLSIEEAEKYFANDDARRCKSTEYAVKHGAWVSDNSWGSNAGYSFWWLRSPLPNFSNCVYNVNSVGYFDCSAVFVFNDVIRPALWISNKNNIKESVKYSKAEK